MVVKKYPCKQAELYAAARIGWISFKSYNSNFTTLKPFYGIPPYYADRVAEIDVAQKMDSVSVRNSKVSLKRLNLEKVAAHCCSKWQDLKLYINSAYADADERELKYKEAGAVYYEGAAHENWDSVEELMNAGESFITNNTITLSANDNMPPAFPTEFSTLKSSLEGAAEGFFQEEESEEDLGEDKVIANNLVYETLIDMFTDGQKIFRDDDGKKKQFVFDNVLQLVRNKVASLYGDVTTNIPNENLSGFEVEVVEKGESVLTDDAGSFDFGTLAADVYTVICSKDGYITQTISNVEVLTGTAKKLSIVMKKA